METRLPTPMTARVYVNLPEGKSWSFRWASWARNLQDFGNLIVRWPSWPSWPAEGKGDGKGANRSGTNGALDRQNDRRNSALPKAAGIAPQARWDEMGWDGMRWDEMGWDGMRWDEMGWDGMRWDEMGWDGMRCFNHAMNLNKSHLTQKMFKMF